MMKDKFEGFGAAMGPGDGGDPPDSAEDRALWQLMGVLEDEKPAADFVDRVRDQILTVPRHMVPWYRRSWVPAAAAVLMVAIALPFLLKGKGNEIDQPNPKQGSQYQSVVDLLDGLSDSDVLALETSEEEIVQADYFGR